MLQKSPPVPYEDHGSGKDRDTMVGGLEYHEQVPAEADGAQEEQVVQLEVLGTAREEI